MVTASHCPAQEETHQYLANFTSPEPGAGNGQTVVQSRTTGDITLPWYENEFWTASQRQGSSLQEISYRACFKPQLPRFFITLLTRPGDLVYDPFSGRGTTAIEAVLLDREAVANDVNPLSALLAAPRLSPPDLSALEQRLAAIPRDGAERTLLDLSMFYHEKTLAEILSLRDYLISREQDGTMDPVDHWIRMVATNRLTGHSPGFFSVYTLPPNQAVSPQRQQIINARRQQIPPYRDTHAIILKKSRNLLRSVTPEERCHISQAGMRARFLTGDARSTPSIPDGAVSLTVTSPPFLDVVQYTSDNWLRCWFCGIDIDEVAEQITIARTLSAWCWVMGAVFIELFRVTAPGGYVAFEVGEVRGGTISLDEHVIPLGTVAGFSPVAVVVNRQEFTKTAHIWGVTNNTRGTNTNRIVLFRRPV